MNHRVGVHTVVVTGSDGTDSGDVAAALADLDGLTVEAQSSLPDSFEAYDGAVVVDAPPASDGIALFERIRDRDVLVPVLLVGLDADAARLETALEAGVTDYVTWGGAGAEAVAARLRPHVGNPGLDGAAQAARWNSIQSAFAHDVKNPLNVISGRMELLDAEQTHADAITRSLDRVESLTDAVSAVASFGGPSPETEPLALDEVAPPVWAGLTSASATLDVRTDRAVEANRDYLEELLARLFDNAVVHGGEDVTAVLGDSGDGFYVADDGPGIDAADRSDVFEQGYGTTRGGEGYGLFVADCIAAAHGWSLSAGESDRGGARIDIHLG